MTTEHWLTFAGILLTLVTTLSSMFVAYGRLQRGQEDLKGNFENTATITGASLGKMQSTIDETAKTVYRMSTVTEVQAANFKAMAEMAVERHTALAAQIDEVWGTQKQHGSRIHHSELALMELKGEIASLKERIRDRGAA